MTFGSWKCIPIWLMEMPNDIWLMEMSTDILNHNLLPSHLLHENVKVHIYIWKYNFACCFICVCVLNLVCHIKGKIKADGDQK
jgi:hypothetical protein